VKNSGILYRGWSKIQKQHFSRFYGTIWLSCTQPTGNSFTPNQWYWWKAETLKVCLLLVWTGESVTRHLADRAYRPLTGAEKWSRDHHENLHIGTRRKIHWSQKCYSFRSATKSHQYIRLVITCSCTISYSYPLVHLLWCQRGSVDKLLAHSTCMLWWRFYFSCLSSFTQLLHRSDLCRFTLRSAWSTVSMFFFIYFFSVYRSALCDTSLSE